MTDRFCVRAEQNLLLVLGRTNVDLKESLLGMKLHQLCIVIRRIQAMFSPSAGTQAALGHYAVVRHRCLHSQRRAINARSASCILHNRG